MDKQEWMQELKQKANQMHIILSDTKLEEFYQYMQLLQTWNEKMNLTAITDEKEILFKHFIDSLSILPYIEQANCILDVGTGAGFPGIPLKIVQEDKQITLLDALQKRITFLEEVIKTLGLSKIEAKHGRAEEFVKEKGQREGYDVVTSRAVARLSVLLEYMLPFVKVGGLCVCMKSEKITEELEEAKKAIELLGGKIQRVEEIRLPQSDMIRKIVIIQKIKNTPSKYPRKAGTPAKDPIK